MDGKCILVPLDGSPLAEQALPVAVAIARRSGSRLHLAMAVPEVPVVVAAGGDFPLESQSEPKLRDALLQYLQATAETVRHSQQLDVTLTLLDGTPVSSLAEQARRCNAGLIVMTTHGHAGVTRLWLGSFADRLLRVAEIPLLLLRPSDGVPHTEFRRILVAMDGTTEGECVLECATELGSASPDAHFTLAQVIEPPVSLITRVALSGTTARQHWRELEENSARTYLDRLASRMRVRRLRVTTQVISAHGAGEQVLDLANAIRADLIVVGTHGAGCLERMLLGSVADKIIRGAWQAVLVVPTRREAHDNEPNSFPSRAAAAYLGDRAANPGRDAGRSSG